MKFTLPFRCWCFLIAIPAHSAYTGEIVGADVRFDSPRVYTAVVSKSSGSFVSEVDLLKVEILNSRFLKIFFLVHDTQEFEYLKTLHPSKFLLESNMTQDLHQQMQYDDTNLVHRQQRLYDTIPGFSCYKSLQGTYEWMIDMVERAKSIPNLVLTMTDIGDSYLKTEKSSEGYDIYALKITGDTGVAAAEKGIFFAMSGIHAREYAPTELASRWAEYLIDSYTNDADITSLLDHTEIHLVLQSNPDGRAVAETTRSVMRRKNLNPTGGASFFPCGPGSSGVDLNRNFPFRWGLDDGSSNNKCSETFRGESPGSEPEVQAIMQYCESIFPEGQRKADPEVQAQEAYDEATTKGIFFDIHAYGELIIFILGLKGHQELETGNDIAFKALASKYKHFNRHAFSGPFEGYLYPASGTSDDWAYGTLGAAAMTFELGNQFYQDCEYFQDSILPGNIEALTYAAKTSRAPFSLSKGPDVTNITISTLGESLTVTAIASDSAWSSQETAQQTVSEIRIYVNEYPGEELSGTVVTGDTITVDISTLPEGRHMVYIQATDSEGYKGPVTAAYFTKGGNSNSSLTTSSPMIAPDFRPIGSPVASPTVASSTSNPPSEATIASISPVVSPTAPILPFTRSPQVSPVAAPSLTPILAPSLPVASTRAPDTSSVAPGTRSPVVSPIVTQPSAPMLAPSQPVVSSTAPFTSTDTSGTRSPVASPIVTQSSAPILTLPQPVVSPTAPGSSSVAPVTGSPLFSPTGTQPSASKPTPSQPVVSPTAPIAGSGVPESASMAPFPVASPVNSPVVPVAVDPSNCVDTEQSFPVDLMSLDQNCDWLAINMERFSFLCSFVDVATACPRTCGSCDLFG